MSRGELEFRGGGRFAQRKFVGDLLIDASEMADRLAAPFDPAGRAGCVAGAIFGDDAHAARRVEPLQQRFDRTADGVEVLVADQAELAGFDDLPARVDAERSSRFRTVSRRSYRWFRSAGRLRAGRGGYWGAAARRLADGSVGAGQRRDAGGQKIARQRVAGEGERDRLEVAGADERRADEFHRPGLRLGRRRGRSRSSRAPGIRS
jgi:hypothetical protein